MDAKLKVMLTNNITTYIQLPYKSHRTHLTNHIRSISHHNTPLAISSLGGGCTCSYMHTQKHIHIHVYTEAILRNRAHAKFKNTCVKIILAKLKITKASKNNQNYQCMKSHQYHIQQNI